MASFGLSNARSGHCFRTIQENIPRVNFKIETDPLPLEWCLGWPPLRAIGAISYGLYIYHCALFTAFYYCGVSDWRTYIGIPASLALATVSSLGMERPLLRPWRRLDAAASLIARLLDNHRFLDHP